MIFLRSLSLLKANNYAYARMKNPGWPGKEISKQKVRGVTIDIVINLPSV